ncbi:hypothetical protein GCM10022216_14550 [Sphingobacterium kyonggiense]|uniref:Uncharacterized protein n=1 Tax=Sphingobacterium kyonggiense TaxID=714075 RepID=A0ABP7YMH1_9SPHI
MITVNSFHEICQNIVDAIHIDGHIVVSTEEQATKKLKDKANIRLVAVYPNYNFTGERDNELIKHELLFFMVSKQNEGASEKNEQKQYSDTQDAIFKLQDYLFGNEDHSGKYCELFPNIDVESVSIEPQYNIFGGYLGWSLVVEC